MIAGAMFAASLLLTRPSYFAGYGEEIWERRDRFSLRPYVCVKNLNAPSDMFDFFDSRRTVPSAEIGVRILF